MAGRSSCRQYLQPGYRRVDAAERERNNRSAIASVAGQRVARPGSDRDVGAGPIWRCRYYRPCPLRLSSTSLPSGGAQQAVMPDWAQVLSALALLPSSPNSALCAAAVSDKRSRPGSWSWPPSYRASARRRMTC